jgi:hypothetical protein
MPTTHAKKKAKSEVESDSSTDYLVFYVKGLDDTSRKVIISNYTEICRLTNLDLPIKNFKDYEKGNLYIVFSCLFYICYGSKYFCNCSAVIKREKQANAKAKATKEEEDEEEEEEEEEEEVKPRCMICTAANHQGAADILPQPFWNDYVCNVCLECPVVAFKLPARDTKTDKPLYGAMLMWSPMDAEGNLVIEKRKGIEFYNDEGLKVRPFDPDQQKFKSVKLHSIVEGEFLSSGDFDSMISDFNKHKKPNCQLHELREKDPSEIFDREQLIELIIAN